MAAALGAGILDFALPPRCPGCGAIVQQPHSFCLECWSGLDFLGGPACRRCGAPSETVAVDACEECERRPPAFDRVAAAVAYGPAARAVALRLKYGRRPGLAETMARLMARLVPPTQVGVLMPVPLHRWRLWSRGFNQAALIAKAIGRRTGLPVDLDALRRVRATPAMRGMGPAERARTVAGVFAVHPGVAGQEVLLVDDVYTTGATAQACAVALKRAGAARVEVLCWARVVRLTAEVAAHT